MVVESAQHYGHSELSNGRLLDFAIGKGFDVFVTCDKDFRQYEFSKKKIGMLVLLPAKRQVLEANKEVILDLVQGIGQGDFQELNFFQQGQRRGFRM